MNQTKHIQELFAEKGIKITLQRIAVYKALTVLGHACAEDVVDEVHKEHATISIGTIYNTLDCLFENGLIAKINTGNNKKYYDVNTHPHHHLYCEKSHRIDDFNDIRLEEMIREYIMKQPIEGFRLSDIKVQLFGDFQD